MMLVFLTDQAIDLRRIQAIVFDVEQWRQQNLMIFAALFFALYVLVTATSLPVAVWMTLAAGALFGFWWGLLLVSFASSIGATMAFLLSRYLLRDWVQAKLGDYSQTINTGLEKDGIFYLFSLRLIPALPFFAVNLLMGLTAMKSWRFYWVSQLGMLLGTAVYVNAGTQLFQLTSVSDISSPFLLISFAALGLLPWMARFAVDFYQRRKVYAKWVKPKLFDRNVIIIGAGAAGLVSAYIAAVVRAKVTLIETREMGGDCLNYGCVPSKALIKSAKVAHQIKHADRFGLEASNPSFSFNKVMQRIHQVIAAIAPHDSVERYQSLGVEVLQGHAKLTSPWKLDITHADGSITQLTSRSIIIATGAAPFVPALPGLDTTGYLTSDTLWEKLRYENKPPQRLVILGGGPIGCELAQSFARLGSQVTQVEMLDRLMIREDLEVSQFVKEALQHDGVKVLTDHTALSCGVTKLEDNEDKWLEVAHQGQNRRINFDQIIVAVGRAPRLKGFGLEALGISTDKVVQTNDYLATLFPNIYAAGDVAGPYQFTHAAAHQAWYACVNALFGQFKRFKVDYRVMPWATFVDPEVARVGLNEQEAIQQGIPYQVTRYGIDDLDRAICDGAAEGFVKVLTVPEKDKILGVTIVGAHAAELIAEFVIAMKYNLGLNKVLGTIHIYPTMAEANKYVAGDWKRNQVNPKLLLWLKRYHTWRRS
ncbi:MAG: FAD-dependent oxidoreductase [Oceanospirillaceae bacterium]|nr:FAD-dependent oxidoreductase [Oceanospirillaceae bacterium]MBT6100143.1 FAD-dependent oxidoreductase [Oceanospirillaceae bacterium]